MKKNTNQDCKSTKLVASLNENLLKNGQKLNTARPKLIAFFILALCKVQTVSFHKLAAAFDTISKKASSLRRVQRFILGFELCSDLIAKLIFSMLPWCRLSSFIFTLRQKRKPLIVKKELHC